MTVRIPIQLGQRTTLYDVAFEGNTKWSGQELLETADYPLGSPLSTLALDAARQRIINQYRDAGYAYASVRNELELTPDRTRARARFVINEHEPVVITGYVVLGARRTDPDLIIGRLALCTELDECTDEERYYRRDLVRKSEEQIATLGTFTSVTIGLEDPEVPQKHKRVVITVVEQPSQYLEPRVGFSTGEGFRMAFEYGHRNIGGQAIALTVRLELSILPDLLIVEQDVRDNYDRFTLSERLERRNRASVRFPEVGLGPLVALTLDGIDVRDNQRDYGLTKDAFIPTLSYTPVRVLRFQLAASTELNDVEVFGADSVEQAVRQNPNLAKYLRVPDGRTLALAQRLGAAWDRRDNALAATTGTLVAMDVEHVHAFPLDETATIESEFLRLSGRSAAYLKLTDSGLVLAVSLGGGYNIQLTDSSQTYPDRLFYLGGVDTLRGFPLDSVVPEDIAQRVLDGELPVDSIAVRGGDLYVNPRAELRIPLGDTFSLGAFLDTGNVWTGEAEFDSPLDLLQLRYALGSGLRIGTPIGPIALDLGFNLLRREWEDLAAVHFSIGLF
jgi:outer membrane protein assembly factor BamA